MTRRVRTASAAAALALGLPLATLWWLTRRPLRSEAPSRAETTRAAQAPLPEPAVPADPDVPASATLRRDAGGERPAALHPHAPGVVRTERSRTPSFERTENYVFAGVDRTRGRWWGRADTLLVAVFDDTSGHLGVVSLPRDLYVDVPGHGPARINATLRIATRTDQDPLELLREVVSATLALPIHHVVIGDLESFERTVDRIGGVTVDVPCPIEDHFIDPRTPSGRRPLRVQAGRQPMDGVTAAMYVRSRHGRSDWSRARRQQAVLLALRDRLRELAPLEWLPVLADALDEGVVTTLSRLEMFSLARRIWRIEPERVHGLLIGHRQVVPHRTPEGRAVLLPDFDAVDALLGELFEAPSPGIRPQGAPCQPADVALR